MRRYGLALLAVLFAFAVRYALTPFLDDQAPFIVFLPALIAAGLFCGPAPTLFATVLSFVLASRFISQSGSWFPTNFHDLLVGGIYVASVLVVVWLINLARSTALQLREEVEQRRRTEEELRRSETQVQKFLDYSPNVVFIKDLEGRYTLVNATFSNVIRSRDINPIGKTDAETFDRDLAELFHSHDVDVLKSGIGREFEETFVQEDGVHTYLVNKVPLRDDSGKIYAIGGIATDITPRKRAEEEMCRAREGYADLVNSIDGIVWEAMVNPLRFTFVSRQAERLLLYPIERWTTEYDFWEKHIHPKDREWATEYCARSLRERRDHDFEYRMIAADGRVVWLRDIVKVNVQKDGTVGLRGVMVDVTESKKTEQALQESEERLRVLAETAADAIISCDSRGNIVQFNRAAERTFGFRAEEIKGLQIVLLLPQSNRERYRQGLTTFLETHEAPLIGHTTEIIGLHKDGTEFPIELSLSTWETSGATFFTAIVRDITERKRAVEALRRSEGQLRMIAEGSGADLWSWDITHDRLECPTIHAPFGFDQPIPLTAYLEHVHPQDREAFEHEIRRCLAERRDLNYEFRVIWPDGSIGWRHSMGRPTFHNASAVHFSGISLDITKRKNAEQALAHNEELLRMTTEGASIGLWRWAIQADTIQLNSVGYGQLGLDSRESIRLDTFISRIHPNDREMVRSAIQRCLEQHCDFDVEHRIIRRDGVTAWIQLKGRLSRMNGYPTVLSGMSLDITERKLAQHGLEEARSALANHAEELERVVAERTAQLQSSFRDMESFCYNIAHDLRAPLRGMRGFVFALEEDYGSRLDETARLYCERIREAANRMDQLISDLLTFGRLSHLELPTQIVDLNEEIEKVLAQSYGEIQEKHAEIQLDKPLPKVCADAPVLDQILENLIANAVKFVPAERQPHVHIYAESHEEFVRIWVEDNGIGIAPEHHNRIFGPFQRLHTGETYPGTGIGLAIVQRGVEKMGGHVGVESEPGKGSRFWIELPGEENHNGSKGNKNQPAK